MKTIGASIGWVALFSIIAGSVYGLAPSVRSPTLHAYVFAVGAAALLAGIKLARHRAPLKRSELDAAVARSQPPNAGISQLERMQREVTIGCASEADFQQHLLPHLREIATARLARSGRTPGPKTLGRWWDVLRPDREPPEDRFAPGIPFAQLRELVADLDRLS
ncbi:MAG TPA: hypothetical protein VGH52_10025 [Gaiellaceae bacterium]